MTNVYLLMDVFYSGYEELDVVSVYATRELAEMAGALKGGQWEVQEWSVVDTVPMAQHVFNAHTWDDPCTVPHCGQSEDGKNHYIDGIRRGALTS